jgi:UDP-N-acetylglucosamine diphosphorylase / glucose-1-phosphate thymidylyltransferase / UDP-N-acetylgalactosamine diphosphorylase / glucosamine-1-phosphate N-acetyltransferase / galactosamine-1-phosphate N-acetyltransferase
VPNFVVRIVDKENSMPAMFHEFSEIIVDWKSSLFGGIDEEPWQITSNSASIIVRMFDRLGDEYVINNEIAVHKQAIIENGAIIKSPAILSVDSFVAAGSYIRGGVFIGVSSIIGPNSELKSTFIFHQSKLAHLNFVGDSIIGTGVNIEAGAVVANYRNERNDKLIRINNRDRVINTGVEKFGALIGDGVRIGANAVIAPGAILEPNSRVGRLQLVDQAPESS